MAVVDVGMHRKQLDGSHAEPANVVDHLGAHQPGERSAHVGRNVGVAHRVAAHVQLVDDRALPRHLRPALRPPGEGRIDHAALRDEGLAVARVERQVLVGRAERIAEHGRIPRELADQLLGIGVDEQLVRIEPMAGGRLVGPMHPIGVDGAGPRIRQVAVPDLVGVFGQLDAFELALALDVEQAELDLVRVRGKQREIHARSVPGGAERKRAAFAHPRRFLDLDRPNGLVHGDDAPMRRRPRPRAISRWTMPA